MKDEEKSKVQLIEELADLRKLVDKKRDDDLFHLALLDLIEDPIAVVDGEFTYVYANKKAVQLLNIEKEDILGKSVYDFFPENEAGPMVTSLQSVFESGVALRQERQFGFSIQPIWLDSQLVPVKNASGIVEKVLSTSRNITERKQAEEALIDRDNDLRNNNKFIESVLENIPNMIFVKDAKELRFVRLNKAAEELLGYSREELIGKNDSDIFPKEEADFFISKDRIVLNGGECVDIPEESIQTNYKGKRILHTKKISILDEEGNPQYLLGISEDITERKSVEKTLLESEQSLQEAQKLARIGNWEWDLTSNTAKWSKEMYRIFDIKPGTFDGNPESFLRLVHPDDVEIVSNSMDPNLREGSLNAIEYRIIRKDGSIRFLFAQGKLLFNDNGDPIKNIGTIQDVTNRKKAEEQIKASLKEKETLLKEIHHRVKNNMQVLSSLISLQRNNVDDVQIKNALKESEGRIYAMATIHETLHQSTNLSEIDLNTYLTVLSGSLVQMYTTNTGDITLNIECDEIMINIQKANPLGLTINELISNSLKHAFPKKNNRHINICAKLSDKKDLEIVVSDNGVGMPKDFDWRKTNTLGLHLVRDLVEKQLRGSVDMDSTNGTTFTIKFKIET